MINILLKGPSTEQFLPKLEIPPHNALRYDKHPLEPNYTLNKGYWEHVCHGRVDLFSLEADSIASAK